MPPPLDTSPNPDFPASRVTELPPDVGTLSAFFGLEGYSAALVATNYTRKELTEQLVEQARNATKPSDRLKAIQMLHDMGLELLEVNGILQTQKASHAQTLANGHTLQQVAERRTLDRLRQGSSRADISGAIVHTPTRPGDYNPNTPAAIAARASNEGATSRLYGGAPGAQGAVGAGPPPAEHPEAIPGHPDADEGEGRPVP